jgi:hypothetical protein
MKKGGEFEQIKLVESGKFIIFFPLHMPGAQI